MHLFSFEPILKNSVAVETEILHLQPFTNDIFHFLIIVESAFQVMLQWSKQIEHCCRFHSNEEVEWLFVNCC